MLTFTDLAEAGRDLDALGAERGAYDVIARYGYDLDTRLGELTPRVRLALTVAHGVGARLALRNLSEPMACAVSPVMSRASL
jgi:hypothetical protein